MTVEQSSTQADPTNGSPIVFDVKFSEPVTGLEASDFVVGGTAGGTKSVSLSGSGATYTASVTGMTTTGTVVLSLPAGAATGPGGRDSAASTSVDNSVTFNESRHPGVLQHDTISVPTSGAAISLPVADLGDAVSARWSQ